MKFDTYLFDFDGTFVNSMPAYISAMLKILDEHNIKYGDDIVKIITPLGYAGTARYFKELGVNLSEDEMVKQMKVNAYDEYAYNIQAKENVVSVLKELKKGGASLNILTASPHEVLDVCLKRIGIFDLFAKDGEVLNSACFDVLPEDGYIRITITDHKGKSAYTNAYFTDEIL